MIRRAGTFGILCLAVACLPKKDAREAEASAPLAAPNGAALAQALDATTTLLGRCTGWYVTRTHVVTSAQCATAGRVVATDSALDLVVIEASKELPATASPLRGAKAFAANGQDVLLLAAGRGVPCRARAAVFPNGGDGSDDPHQSERAKNAKSFVVDCEPPAGALGAPVIDARTLEVVGINWNDSRTCKWAHFAPDGVVGQVSADVPDRIPYQPGGLVLGWPAVSKEIADFTD